MSPAFRTHLRLRQKASQRSVLGGWPTFTFFEAVTKLKIERLKPQDIALRFSTGHNL